MHDYYWFISPSVQRSINIKSSDIEYVLQWMGPFRLTCFVAKMQERSIMASE